MIPRLKGVIAHYHDTKLSRENSEDATAGWGTKPNPKAKSFKEDPGDTLTCGWGNRPNPGKDFAPALGWGNRPNHKKDPTGVED